MEIKQLMARAIEVREKYADLEHRKYGKSWSNTQIMEGFIGDVGDLMKIIMAKDGVRDMDNVDQKLGHELADCLWCVLVLSQKYGVDIEKTFLATMDELDKRFN